MSRGVNGAIKYGVMSLFGCIGYGGATLARL